jgi:Kef-type K+ transport system membrane component KefB
MEELLSLKASPVFAFTVLLAVILAIPPLVERLRLPGLVGLLGAGVVLGPSGLGLLRGDSETMELLSDIGKIYLMFVAGLEINLVQFRRTRVRSLTFGAYAFVFPAIAGILIGRGFGFDWNASILIGSLLASHTLLAYPIVSRLGVVNNEAITVTIGATIFTDTLALLVLAVCVSVHAGDFSPLRLIILLVALGVYSVTVLWGGVRLGKEFFRRSGDQQGNQFLFVLLAVFLASVGAQVIGIEKIVGAFLAGLAVNEVVGNGPVKEKVEFVGSVLFIPFFFVDMGLLLDIPAFLDTLQSLGLTVAIVAGLVASKFVAAGAAKLTYRYTWPETLTMWSLSLPQVAATLAAALVGLQNGIIDVRVFNSVVVLMLVTAIAGPAITSNTASRLTLSEPIADPRANRAWLDMAEVPETGGDRADDRSCTVVVSVYNPITERYLMGMAALLARPAQGQIVALSIARAHVHMDDVNLNNALHQSRKLLQRASDRAPELGVPITPSIRIDDDPAQGISRASREHAANLIVMGWSSSTSIRARLFGNTIDSVFWSAHCPVAVTRLLDEPKNFRRILVTVKNLMPKELRAVRFAQVLAEVNQAHLTLLHACATSTPPDQQQELHTRLRAATDPEMRQVQQTVVVVPNDDPAAAVLGRSDEFDLVIVRSIRRRTTGGLAISQVTRELVRKLNCSVVMLGEPHS